MCVGNCPGFSVLLVRIIFEGLFFFLNIKDDQYHFFYLYMPEECLYQKFSVLFVCVCIYMFVCFLTGEVRRKSSFRQSPLLSAAPVRALIDEQISIKGRFLSQNYPVTVRAQMQ